MSTSSSSETKNRYAICVGINRYDAQNQIMSLRYAEQDAEDVYTLLLTHGFDREHSCLLLGEKATSEAIYHALTTLLLTKARRDDLVVFYFAGHGVPISINDDDEEQEQEPQSDVFLCSTNFDLQKMVDERGAWLGYPLRMQKLRADIFELAASRKVLFIFDSCHSGDFFGKHYRPRTSENLATHYIGQPFGKNSSGRLVLSSCLPHQTSREDERLGHGIFTYHLLEALAGRAPRAINDGWVTFGRLFEYIDGKLPKNQRPVRGGVEHGTFRLVYYNEYVEQTSTQKAHPREDSLPQHKYLGKEHRLKAMLADHTGFVHDRLESFVGRQNELAEIRQRIGEKLRTGGYVTITGQAGQGKSSIIAKLVEEYGVENVAFHFIPFNPGPDHQVGLLRNLMARLILKNDLLELYVASESRPALRDYFPKVLGELVLKGGQEVIFIDGLDQLEEDVNGIRDLSFLPNNPPPGVVFVLGTRPNDTLRPLELLKPYHEHKLPNLSRGDFDLLLNHRNVSLNKELTDRFYEAMQENALYLDLVAKELVEVGATDLVEVIKQVADNPNNIFSLSMARFKRQPSQWREVIKPVLGVLLTAREPMAVRNIRQILEVEDDWLREGLVRLGGLITRDGQRRCYLFHLKLRDYLRQDEGNPEKEYIFATDEQEGWHAKLAKWCEGKDLSAIWQYKKGDLTEQGRREYAKRHYIVHLYESREWQRMFAVLDTGKYGKAKVRGFDPSTRSYAQDLYLGRQAAAWEGETIEKRLTLLPNLWRYTLLQCSLTSRADQYTLEMFEALLLLGHEVEAVGLAELLTKPDYKVRVLLRLAKHVRMYQGKEQESLQLLMRSLELTRLINTSKVKTRLLSELCTELARAKQWEQAEAILPTINDNKIKAEALYELHTELIRHQQWEQAEKVTYRFEYRQDQVRALLLLGAGLAKVQLWDQAKAVWHKVEALALTIHESKECAKLLSELGMDLARFQQWKWAKLVWIEAETAACKIQVGWVQAKALGELSIELAKVQQWEQSKAVIQKIQDSGDRSRILGELSIELAKSQDWKQAETLAHTIESIENRIRVLLLLSKELAKASHLEHAILVWDKILILILEIEDKREKDRMLGDLCTELAKAWQWERAEKVAQSIWDRREAARVLSELARELDKAQIFRQAKTTWAEAEVVARNIQEDWIKDKALGDLSTELVKAQQWEQAERVARSIQNRGDANRALFELSMELARTLQWEQAKTIWMNPEVIAHLFNEKGAGVFLELGREWARKRQWEQTQFFYAEAEKLIHKIEYRDVRAKLLLQLGIELADTGYLEQAQAVWVQAKAIALTADHNEERAVMLLSLGRELAKVEYREQAEEMWSEIPRLVHTVELRGERDQVWLWLYKILTKAQQWEQAERVARSIQNRGEAARMLGEVGKELAKAQQWERAKTIWAEAEVAAYRILDSQERTNVVDRLRTLQYEAWLWLIKSEQWEQAERVAYGIQDRGEAARMLSELGRELAKVQQWEQAKEVARSIQDRGEAVRILDELGIKLIRLQQWERAKTIWAEAEAIAYNIQESEGRIDAVDRLRTLRYEVWLWLIKTEQWEQAESMAHSIQDRGEAARMLGELGRGLAKAQQPEQAMAIWAEAEAMAYSIQESKERTNELEKLKAEQLIFQKEVANGVDLVEKYEQKIHLVQHSWLTATTRENAIELLPLVADLILLKPDIGILCYEAFTWVDTFMKG